MSDPLAYAIPEAAAAVGVSESTLRRAIADHSLIARYIGRKPVIQVRELDAWLESLPSLPPSHTA